jgi:hypothetical protein
MPRACSVPPTNSSPGFNEAITGQVVASNTVYNNGEVSMEGTVGDGCYGEAGASVFGSAQKYLDFTGRLNQIETAAGESWSALMLSPEINSGWVACMKQGGFDYPNFVRPQGSREWPSPRPSDEESRVASADAACRAANHLTDDQLQRLVHELLLTILEAHPMARDAEFDRMYKALLAGPVSPADALNPFEAAVHERVGYSPKQVHDATDHYTAERMRSCLRTAGYNISEAQSELPANKTLGELQSGFVITSVDIATYVGRPALLVVGLPLLPEAPSNL